jgi:hypothetical protein
MAVLEPCLVALLVQPDHEHGLIEVALAANRRALLVISPESALAMAAALVGAVRALGAGGGFRR